MATTYTFSIPTPCTAALQEMTPVNDGRFCHSCEKVVIDFSVMTDRQIIAYLEKNGKCCGSFKPSQLDREMVAPVSPLRKWMPAALMAGMLTIIWPANSRGQYKITGVVKDSARHTPLPGVSILLLNNEGGGTFKGTVTQEDGTFSFSVPEDYNKGMKMRINFVGFISKVVEVSEEQVKGKKPLLWEIKEDDRVLGEYIVVRKASWWRRMKFKLFGR